MYFSSNLPAPTSYKMLPGESSVAKEKLTDKGTVRLRFACIYADEYNYRQISRYTVARGSKQGRVGVTLRALNKSR